MPEGKETYVYLGLPRTAVESMSRRFEPKGEYDDGFEYPQAPREEFFYLEQRGRDNQRMIKLKALRRKKYREERLKELALEMEESDAILTLCGISFSKGEPYEVEYLGLSSGEIAKLERWAKKGNQFMTLKAWEKAGKPLNNFLVEEAPEALEEIVGADEPPPPEEPPPPPEEPVAKAPAPKRKKVTKKSAKKE